MDAGIAPGEQTQNGHFCFLPPLFYVKEEAAKNSGAPVGLTGLEPVTLRLSSACSNQLSYRPWVVVREAGGHGGGKGIRTPDL